MECAGDVEVTLAQNVKAIAATTTDCYGDFKFDGLTPNRVVYSISISMLGCEKRLDIEMNNSVYLDEIRLS